MDTEDCLEFKRPEAKPFFDEYQRQKLKVVKYTRWAENIDAESLYAVLWMVGEYACRSDKKWPRTAGPFMPWMVKDEMFPLLKGASDVIP